MIPTSIAPPILAKYNRGNSFHRCRAFSTLIITIIYDPVINTIVPIEYTIKGLTNQRVRVLDFSKTRKTYGRLHARSGLHPVSL